MNVSRRKHHLQPHQSYNRFAATNNSSFTRHDPTNALGCSTKSLYGLAAQPWLTACLLLLLLQPCSPTSAQAINDKQEPITYKHHYPDASQRPNVCDIAYTFNRSSSIRDLRPGHYVPFIGTSSVRDGQLLLERLYYSLDYPVKYFVVVVSQRAWTAKHKAGGLGYELEHLADYADNAVIVTCMHPPAVTEGWNAVFQAFPEEPWGVYNARDTAWQPRALETLSGHMWKAVQDNNLEIAYFNWTVDISFGSHNAVAMTRHAVDRFGLFDENIYPAFAEDDDFRLRQARMIPPMRVQELKDVQLQHGAMRAASYSSGFHSSSELSLTEPENTEQEEQRKHGLDIRQQVNNQYLHRKWGCPAGGPWFDATFKTPFNKSVPVWYWETSKHQRRIDLGLQVDDPPGSGGKNVPFLDTHGGVIFRMPAHYNNWTGYLERTLPLCRVTGKIGIVRKTTDGILCI